MMNNKYKFLFCINVLLSLVACKEEPRIYKVSFDSYKVADGFEIELAASEPLIEAPVAIDFDNKGRIWVAEMRGFMRDLAGTGEDAPSGRISILEDADNDGRAESSKVFLDSLVLPRGLAHVYGGLLYVTPPYLWFVEINNDKPGKKTLVDSTYAEGGSPEAQANGLMMNIDNWIYSANSNFRYQLKDGKWLKEPTSFRGQFGITKDDVGRLYYNYNTIQIAGDYVLPNTFISNPYYKPKEGINKVLTHNQRVYPLHATTVNRGYVEGVLDKDSMLINVTAACGPLVYHGGQFPDEYNLNAFSCEPQANLVKRNFLHFENTRTTATQAWDDREFLASTDEGFRPVNLSNGPDGSMYVVDMHRGTMEYRAFATPYYNKGLATKKLDTLISAGRILRIKAKGGKAASMPDLSSRSAAELVELLKSKNGWLRDRAQQLLLMRQDKSVVPTLVNLAQDRKNEVTSIHALHLLNGLQALSFELLSKVAAEGSSMLSAHALVLLQAFASENTDAMGTLAKQLVARNDSTINLYLAATLGPWSKLSQETFFPVLLDLSGKYADKEIYQEAIINSLANVENDFREALSGSSQRLSSRSLDTMLSLVIENRLTGKKNPIYVQESRPLDARTNGLQLFRKNCASCHGTDGDGIEHVGPPLKESEYVKGSPSRLAMIILNGLEGPIHVNGKLYNFNNTMPNFGNNFTDAQIADIVRYLHNAFVTTPVKPIPAEKIKALRSKKAGTLTEKELLEMKFGDE
ncbi:MAG TPA: c-type cytochrome [Flavisolibacter sp.]|nr:c-type cytochrome [Flavisolibacter sp.]